MQAMLDRVFGDARIEELSRSFYCGSADLGAGRLVIDRHGVLARAVAASITLPLIAPPARREDALLVDGSLLDNLPVRPMSEAGEGPVLAIDIADGEEPADRSAVEAARQTTRRRLPPLTQTMARLALLSSANTDESTGRYADMTVKVPLAGVGLLEFHQIDAARDAGRRAAQAALENAPEWLVGAASSTGGEPSSRTVIRV
jgi:NTE family protein